MAKTRNPAKTPLDHEPAALRYALDQSGLTMTQLAERAGCTLSLVSEMVAGTRNATPAMIKRLAVALNCPRVVLERKRNPEPATVPPEPPEKTNGKAA